MALVALLSGRQQDFAQTAAGEVGLITLDPGHFHAALFQKEILPGVSRHAWVYAPLGPDLLAHLNRIAQFNARSEKPTQWELEIYSGPDFFERLLRDRPGNVVVISGKNRGKIQRIETLVGAGLHVLADKPWLIEAADLPRLEATLDAAESKGVVAFDAMTQRFEITAILQRALVGDPEIFGQPLTGSLDEPSVRLESFHYLLKTVAGVPGLRPAWFFDIRQQGEGLADVGTHLADIVPWILFPDQPIAVNELELLRATRWPTMLSLEQFRKVTGENDIPDFVRNLLVEKRLPYFCNNTVSYRLRGIHVMLSVRWGYEAEAGSGDTELAIFRGGKARVEMRQEREQNFRREVYVVPVKPEHREEILVAVNKRLRAMASDYPGLLAARDGDRIRIEVPNSLRIGHEEHFALVVKRFLDYVHNPKSVPAWEKLNMIAKYYVTTKGVELARAHPSETH